MMREDWIEVELGDITSKITDGSHNPPKKQDVGLPMLSATNILDDKIVFDNYRLIDPVEFESECKRANVEPEDILLTIVGTIGRSAVVPQNIKKFTLQRSVALIKLEGLNSKYISFALRSPSIQSFFKEQSKGTAQKGIYLNTLKKITIPFAPLPEQSAIASKIEQLFSELDNGIANLKTAKSKLEIYRFTVLNLAVVDRSLQKISNVIDGLSQGWSPKCREESSKDINEWAVIKTSAIQSGKFIEEENKILPDNLIPREQHEIKVNDILITRAGPRVRVGICCLVRKTRPKLINCDKVYRLRVKNKIILPTYFEYLMNSLTYIHKIEEIKTGGNDSGLNLTQVRYLNIEIPVPSLEEQTQIVQEIETRLSVCDKLNEAIDQSLEKAQALRQSILKKAFEGKLLSQDELQNCRQQPDWEPAAKLLEKVKKNSKTKR
ncbi:hypothetical protein PseudUWO311_07920 [Pseudanabaena sp. UWO311]|uniref:restriction endonuclease subunit S n=1 Tax=Pseudanabaena sp. UWO311 TaxID=2487337 RepID=UPI001158F79F|nr:restriction endonuclease subunit S [Pseudanabaena sp. UWO311]TYQ27577.1 hypothetical protein PseudUWO311_07920 [Pseudanabaena sp. UWO311]